jgi:crotonobetainyl-CoA:carnitine CoA-transferase CaiB-like acyl-CoA transferase
MTQKGLGYATIEWEEVLPDVAGRTLECAGGIKLFLELVKKADILIENFRPGVMDKLGLGYDTLKEINDQLIYAAVSGFGSYGPYAQRPGYDIIAQAMGGLMSITGPKGSPPTRCGNAMGDILGGMNLTIGILAAVNARQIIGHGQRVDVALVDSVVVSLENAFTRYFDSGVIPQRNGNMYPAIAPYDSYMAKDGYVIIACGNQKLYEKFCNELLHMPEMIADARFRTVSDRVTHNEALKVCIETWTRQHTVEEIVDLALCKGIPASPIYDLKQITEDEHISQAREMFVEIEHPIIGPMKVFGNPVKLMDTMPAIKTPSPALGQHNEEIFMQTLGLTREQMDQFAADGVI